jgi:hypothetical protein
MVIISYHCMYNHQSNPLNYIYPMIYHLEILNMSQAIGKLWKTSETLNHIMDIQ